MKLNKKGYFFMLDAILALSVLSVGIFLLFSSYTDSPDTEQVTFLSSDLINYFATNKIEDVNNLFAGYGGTLWDNGTITNEDATLLQQLGELYDDGNLAIAELFIINLTQNIVPNQFAFEIWMDDTLLYPRNPGISHNRSKNITEVLLPSRKVVYGFTDETQGNVFGPYIAEVFVWQDRS